MLSQLILLSSTFFKGQGVENNFALKFVKIL